jgi:hypothetical protein
MHLVLTEAGEWHSPAVAPCAVDHAAISGPPVGRPGVLWGQTVAAAARLPLPWAPATVAAMPFATKGGVASSPMTGLPQHLLGYVGATGFGASSTAEEVAKNWDGSGRVVLITGAATGERDRAGCVSALPPCSCMARAVGSPQASAAGSMLSAWRLKHELHGQQCSSTAEALL